MASYRSNTKHTLSSPLIFRFAYAGGCCIRRGLLQTPGIVSMNSNSVLYSHHTHRMHTFEENTLLIFIILFITINLTNNYKNSMHFVASLTLSRIFFQNSYSRGSVIQFFISLILCTSLC